MKKFVIAAAMAAALTTPALANDLNSAGDDLAIVSTQGTTAVGLGGLGVGGTLAMATMVLTALTVSASSSTTGN